MTRRSGQPEAQIERELRCSRGGARATIVGYGSAMHDRARQLGEGRPRL
jgi:hypothetical protein